MTLMEFLSVLEFKLKKMLSFFFALVPFKLFVVCLFTMLMNALWLQELYLGSMCPC